MGFGADFVQSVVKGAAKCPPDGLLTHSELAFQSICTELSSRAQDVMNAAKDRKSYVYARTVHYNVSTWRSELRDLTKLQPNSVALKLVQSALQYVVGVKERLNCCVDETVLEYMRAKQRIVVEFATFVSSANQEDRNHPARPLCSLRSEDVQNALRDCLRAFIELEAAIKQASLGQAQGAFKDLLDSRSCVWMETVSVLRGLVNSWLRGCKNASARYVLCSAAAAFLSRKKAVFHEVHAQDAELYHRKLADAEALAAALVEEENNSKLKPEKCHKKRRNKQQTAESQPSVSAEAAKPDYSLTTHHISEMSARMPGLPAQSEESQELQSVCDKQPATVLSESLQLLACPLTKAVIEDPVILADGHTYERQAAEMWLRQHNHSQVSGALLDNKRITPNHSYKDLRNVLLKDQ